MTPECEADLRRAGTRHRALAIAAVLDEDRDGAGSQLAAFLDDARFVHDLLDVVFRDLYWSNEQRRLVARHAWLEARWLVELAVRTERELDPEALVWIPADDRAIVAREQRKRLRELLRLVDPDLLAAIKRRA